MIQRRKKNFGTIGENLIGQLIIRFADISATLQYSEILTVSSRKQNIREGLTNITDEGYLFFEKLNNKIRELETFQNLHERGANVIKYIKEEILKNQELSQDWLVCSVLLSQMKKMLSQYYAIDQKSIMQFFLDTLKLCLTFPQRLFAIY